jgi:D-alanyl-D-alanine dipeptidase
MEDKDDSLSITDSSSISITAKKNRKIMSDALIQQGFVNYPTEYWHWSYGDRYWAFMKHQPYAIYDSFLAKNE